VERSEAPQTAEFCVKEHIYIKIQPLIKSWESDTYVYYFCPKLLLQGVLTSFVIGELLLHLMKLSEFGGHYLIQTVIE